MALLAIGIPNSFIERLQALDRSLEMTRSDEQLGDATSAEGFQGLLVGPGAADPVALVQSVHRKDPTLPVMVLLWPGGEKDVARKMLVSPFVSDAATSLLVEDDDEAAAAVRAWATASARRRSYQRTLSSLNELAAGFPSANASPSRYLGRLLEQAPAGVVMLDEQGVILSANRRTVQLFGVAEHELVGRPLAEVFTQEDLSSSLARDALSGPVGPVRLAHERDGGERFFEASAGAVVGREGDPAVLLLLHDITEVVRAERERERAEEVLRYQASLLTAQSEASFEGTLVVDVDGNIVSFNSKFAEMWGIPEEVLETRSDDAALEAVLDRLADRDSFLARVQYLYDHPDEKSVDLIPLRNGGMFERYGAPIRGVEGRHYGRIWFFHDISERARRERQLRFLVDAGQIFGEARDAAEMLRRLAARFTKDIVDRCAVYLVGFDGRLSVTGTASRPDIPSWDAPKLRWEGASDEVPGRAVLLEVPSVSSEEPTSLCVAIPGRGRAIGAILIESFPPRRYDDEDRLLLEGLASRAGLALQNLLLFQQRTHVAEVLQRSLLPPALPHVDGLDIAAAYSPAGEAYDVGGDFYDVFYVGNGRWAAIIGDVMGKGPEAASLTSLARYAVKSAGLQLQEPGAVLALLNEAIFQERDGETFCTATYAVFEPAEDGFQVRLARGGHPPALIVRKEGGLEVCEPEGSLLGLFGEAPVSDVVVDLRCGDTIILYTDGVTEARGKDDRYGFERLESFVATLSGKDAVDVASAIESEVRSFEIRGANDDIAILVLRAVPVAARGAGEMIPERRTQLTPDPSSPGKARAFARSTLTEWQIGDRADDVILLVDELVTNSVLHANTTVDLTFRLLSDRLRVEVRDRDPNLPKVGAVDTAATSGRGLFLVQTVAERWGTEASGRGKVVWFELSLSPQLTNA